MIVLIDDRSKCTFPFVSLLNRLALEEDQVVCTCVWKAPDEVIASATVKGQERVSVQLRGANCVPFSAILIDTFDRANS